MIVYDFYVPVPNRMCLSGKQGRAVGLGNSSRLELGGMYYLVKSRTAADSLADNHDISRAVLSFGLAQICVVSAQ